MAKHNITLTDEQEAALQHGFDNGGTQAADLDEYASEWLGSLLDQYGATIPQQKAEAIIERYKSDPDVAAAVDDAVAAVPIKPARKPVELESSQVAEAAV